MKKHIIKFMLIAMTFGMFTSMNAMAESNEADTDSESKAVNSSITVDRTDNVSIMSDNAMQEGIKVVRMSLQVSPAGEENNIDNVEFEFANPDGIDITDYRYHEDTGVLNIYAADSQPLFQKSNAMDLGSVHAVDESGKPVDIQIEVPANALSMVSDSGEIEVAATYSNEKKELGEHYMDISITHPVDYTVVIPDNISELEADDTLVLEVKDALLEYNQSLDVSVSSENEWKLKDRDHPDNPEKVNYTLAFGYDNTVIARKTEDILSVSNGRSYESVVLTVLDVGDSRTAGTFEDTLTFTIELN